MLSKSGTFLRAAFSWELMLWLFISLIFIWNLHNLLGVHITPGWDTAPHYYITTKMVEFIQQGRISGYDDMWFGGYPLFTLYAPLLYIFMAGIHLLSFQTIPLELVFNATLFVGPWAFLLALRWSAVAWFGEKTALPSLVFGFLFLTAGKLTGYLGIGVSSLVFLGLLSNFYGLIFMILIFGLLKKFEGTKKKMLWVLATLLWGGLLLLHTLTAIFTLGILCLYLLLSFKKSWKWMTPLILGGFVLSSFWFIPFLQSLPFSSGQKLVGDPNGTGLFITLFRNLTFKQIFFLDGITLKGILAFPFPAIVFFSSLLVGFLAMIKEKKYFWVIPVSIAFMVFPHHDVYTDIPMPLHFYRFAPHIFVCCMFVAIFGLASLKFSSQRFRLYSGMILGIMVFFMGSYSYFDLNNNKDNKPYSYHFEFENYLFSQEAEEMVDYIKNLDLSGRVAVQTQSYDMNSTVGSPHYFSTMLPLQGVPVIPGLLAESAYSSSFIIPTMSKMFESLLWGNTSLLANKGFSFEASIGPMVDRIAQFNTEYILVNSNETKESFEEMPERLELVFSSEPFFLFRVNNFRPFLASVETAPVLFVEKGGMGFRDFSEVWYSLPELMNRPLIYTDKSFEEIPEAEREKIQVLVVSTDHDVLVEDAEIQYWEDLGKEFFILNNKSAEDHEQILSFSTIDDLRAFQTKMVEITEGASFESIASKERSEEKVVFDHEGGVAINFSYTPDWSLADPNQTLYRMAPSFMFTFSEGETELIYE